jgi:Lysylphosphatidylglycerol synthase TM region
MKAMWKLTLLLLGVALFGFTLLRSGPGNVMRGLQAIGAGVVVMFGASLLRLLLQTRSWRMALRQDGVRTTTAELMFLRLASQGIGYLTVLGPAASEPIKIKFLQNRGGSAVGATLVDTGVYWLSAGATMLAGCIAAAAVLKSTSTALIAGGIAATIVTAGCFAVRSKCRFRPAIPGAGSAHWPAWLNQAVRIGKEIRDFARTNPRTIRSMFLLDLACQVLLLAEVAIAFWCLHLPLRAGNVLAIEAAGRAVRMIGGWMPARLGADEGGAAAAFVALGLPAASGLAFALARRVRDMLNSLVGLTWIAWHARCREGCSEHIVRTPAITNGELQCKV